MALLAMRGACPDSRAAQQGVGNPENPHSAPKKGLVMASFSRPPAACSNSPFTWRPGQAKFHLRPATPVPPCSHPRHPTLACMLLLAGPELAGNKMRSLDSTATPQHSQQHVKQTSNVSTVDKHSLSVQAVRRTGTCSHLLSRQHERVIGSLPRKAQQFQRGNAALQAAHARLERRVAQADAPELLLAGVLRRWLQRLKTWSHQLMLCSHIASRFDALPSLPSRGHRTARRSCGCAVISRCWSSATPDAGGNNGFQQRRVNLAA